jgi:ABC-type transport system substrate-binding protein
VVLIALLALLSAACGGGGDNAADDNDTAQTTSDVQPVNGGRLNYGLNGETNSFSPATGQWSASGWLVASAIFDPLVYYDMDMNIHPFLAESIDHNDDFTVWTIKLREGVKFQNGEALTADVVKQNFEAQKASPLLAAVLAPILDIKATDELTVELTMANSWAHFPHTLMGQPGYMMAPAMMADPEGGNHPIGTGPFKLEEWVRDSHLLVSKNEDYWGGAPHLNEIDFQVMTDLRSRMSAFEAGDIDMTIVTGTEEASKEHEGATVYSSDVGEEQEVFLLMNQLRPPFNDVALRTALVQGTNAEEIAQVVTGGAMEPAKGIYDPGSPWYDEKADEIYPTYDPDAAKATIAEYEAANGPLHITLSGPTSPIVLQGMQLTKEQWEAIGIDVDLDTQELATYITATVAGDYDVAYWQYHGAGHPDGEFVFLHGNYAAPAGQLGLNFARNVDHEIDDALLQARYTDDADALRGYYNTVQERLATDVPYVMLWHVRDSILARNNVHDVLNWDLPDGTKGADIFAARHQFAQIWMDAG